MGSDVFQVTDKREMQHERISFMLYDVCAQDAERHQPLDIYSSTKYMSPGYLTSFSSNER